MRRAGFGASCAHHAALARRRQESCSAAAFPFRRDRDEGAPPEECGWVQIEDIDPAKAVGVDDLRALVAMVDAAGINRAAGFGYLHSLAETGAKRGAGRPWTKEAEAFALAVVLSGLRGDPPGEIPPASAEAIAAAVEPFSNWDAMAKAGIHGGEHLVAVAAHRLLGAAITAIGGATLEPQRAYRLALMRSLLLGMDKNPVFIRIGLDQAERVPPEGCGRAIKLVLLDAFGAVLAKQVGFERLDSDLDGTLSVAEIAAGFDALERRSSALTRSLGPNGLVHGSDHVGNRSDDMMRD